MAEQKKPNTIFYSLSQTLRNNKKDIPTELSQTQDTLDSRGGDNFVQQQQQRFADFQTLKVAQDLYSRSMYYDADRVTSYNDYRAMDQSPEISVALDIMADECLAFDTIIPLLNGEKITIEDLYKQNRNQFWVYSYNIDKQQIEPGLCERVVYKGEQDVYEVVFDDDSSIKATGEHMWLLKNEGKYVETKNLKLGDSIEPFYTRISNESDRINGYEMVLCKNGKWEYTHRIVKNKIYKEQKGVCHHKDFNKKNNNPENLQVMDYYEHQKLHSSLNSEKWKNPEFAAKMKKVFSETNSKNGKYWSNEQWAKKRKKSAKEKMLDYCSKLSEQERKERFGLTGEKNGMFNNGYKLKAEKNGRYLHNLNHEFDEFDIIEAYKKTSNIDEACILLKTNKVILRKSKVYNNLNLNRWEDLNLITNNLNLFKLDELCEYYSDKFILERNAKIICNILSINIQLINKFLRKNGFKNWSDYTSKFNSREKILNVLKKEYLQTQPNKFGRIPISHFAQFNNKSTKQIESFLSRTKYKNWKNFVNSINHSIKSIKLIGKVKTYDLINVSDNNNYAILTTNGTGVFVHNCVTRNDRGEILTIYSEDARIKRVLTDMFHGTLNINYNLWFWIRTLLKYGDNFLKLDLDQKLGVYGITQLPTGEIHKEVGYDGNPYSVRFKWDINNMYFEDFQIAHFSLVSEGEKMPYGRSVLDPVRKLWKQLQLAEDALLVYRLVRAPERRMFFIDVGNTDTLDVRQYIEKMKAELKKSQVVDSQGRINMKFNLITFEEDFFIPVRGDKTGTRVETLPGATNLGDIADIEYLQNKLFTGIKVPKTYLNYGEALPGGSTLSQADLRFARTINRFQEAVILELRNIANIHLKMLGFDDDINNFTLTLTNPSTQQELLKLETMKARLDVFKEMFSSDATAPVSYTWAMEYILGFSKAEIKQILRQKKIERKMFYEIERAHEEYMDTGIFTELDKKFRKPDFDPNTQIDTEQGGEGGDSSGGGGGFGGFGGGSSFGLGDTDTSGMDDLGAGDGLGGGDTSAGAESGTEEQEPADNLKENLLLTKNKTFDNKTKSLLEGVNSFLEKINKLKNEK